MGKGEDTSNQWFFFSHQNSEKALESYVGKEESSSIHISTFPGSISTSSKGKKLIILATTNLLSLCALTLSSRKNWPIKNNTNPLSKQEQKSNWICPN